MKSQIVFFFLFFLISIVVRSQQLHRIKFISQGEETKPVGTIIISLETIAPLTDKYTDSTFGKSIKTDIETFMIVRSLIKEDKYRTPNPTELDWRHHLKIEDSDGFTLNLIEAKYHAFFDDLRFAIKHRHGDEAVIELFKYYY